MLQAQLMSKVGINVVIKRYKMKSAIRSMSKSVIIHPVQKSVSLSICKTYSVAYTLWQPGVIERGRLKRKSLKYSRGLQLFSFIEIQYKNKIKTEAL